MAVVRIVLFLLAVTGTAVISPLHAQSTDNLPSQSLSNIFSRTIENSLQGWMREIMHFGGASGRIGSISTRSGDRALVVDAVSVRVPGLDLSIEIGEAILESPRLRDDDFVAQANRMVLSDVTIKQGQMEFVAETFVAEQAALPRLDIPRLGNQDSGVEKFERQRQFLAQILSFEGRLVTIPTLTVRTYSSKKETELLGESIYRQNVVNEMKGRRIARWNISSTLSLSPPLEPILRESFQKTEFRELNLDAVTTLLDPATNWNRPQVLLGGLSVRDYSVEIGGLTFTVDETEALNLTLETLDQETKSNLITVAQNPKGIDAVPKADVPPFLLNLASAIDIEKLDVTQVRTHALGIDTFSIGSMGLSQASLGGFSEVDVQDFQASLTDLGAVHINRANIRDAEFPDKDLLREKLDGGEVATADLMPTFTSVFLDGFDASVPELALQTGIESLVLQTRTDASKTPNGVEMTLRKLRFPTALIPEGSGLIARLTNIVRAMDTDTVVLDQSLMLEYDSAQNKLDLKSLDIDIENFGRLQIAAQINDISTSPFADPATASRTIRKGKLMGSHIEFSNDGVVEAGFEAQAAKLNTKGDVLRGQVGATLPFLVAVLQNQRFQKELVTALQAFLPNPDSLVMELKPDDGGVSIADIDRQLRGDPRKLLALLGVTIQNKPDSPPSDTDAEQLPN